MDRGCVSGRGGGNYHAGWIEGGVKRPQAEGRGTEMGLKGHDKEKSDCINAELSDTRCLMGFNCRIAIRGHVACY